MLVIQVGCSFVLWIALAWVVALNARKWRPALSRMSRRARVTLGPILMLIGAAALLGGFGLVAAIHGLTGTGLTPLGWTIVTLIGVIFVGLQAVSSLLMVSLATENEPGSIAQASEGRINDRNSHE